MGYGIDPRFAPRKLRWHWSSRGPRMLAAAAGGGDRDSQPGGAWRTGSSAGQAGPYRREGCA